MVSFRCVHCRSERVVKDGFTQAGKQRVRCRGCGKRSHQAPTPRGASAEKQAMVLAALGERMSLRPAARTFRMSRDTITGLLGKKTPGKKDTVMMQEQSRSGIGYFETMLLSAQEGDVLELDEVWSFVFRKSQQVWIWLALCRRTRQIVAWMPGPRDHITLKQLWNKIPDSYKRLLQNGHLFHRLLVVTPKSFRKSNTTLEAKQKGKPTTSNASTAPSDRACRAWSGRPSPSPSATSGTSDASDTSSSPTTSAKPKPTYDNLPSSKLSPPKRPIPVFPTARGSGEFENHRLSHQCHDAVLETAGSGKHKNPPALANGFLCFGFCSVSWPRPRTFEPLIYRLHLTTSKVVQVLSASVRVASNP